MLKHRALTERVIGLAIEVHRTIGPGLLESAYTECLCLELEQAGISFETQVTVPVIYKDTTIPLGFRADTLVDRGIIIEIKAIAALLPAHEAQLLTDLRMSRIAVGLLMNFMQAGSRTVCCASLSNSLTLRGAPWSFVSSVLKIFLAFAGNSAGPVDRSSGPC